MSTLNTIQATDLISDSRADINNNFNALNTDKMETSVLDTDTTLAANSDSKVPTQKAVKAYVDAGGNVNASETTKGIVEEATSAEAASGTAVGSTGARLYINPSAFPTLTLTPIIATGSTTKDNADATGGTTVIAHGLGITPTFVSLKAVSPTGNGSSGISIGEWYTGGYVTSASLSQSEGGSSSASDDTLASTSIILMCGTNDTGEYQTATIAVDTTNITLTWTKTGTPLGTWNIVWLAKIDTITKS